MKIAGSYAEALRMIDEYVPLVSVIGAQRVNIGVDIGKQFGTRIIMRIDRGTAKKLLIQLQQRDLPLPHVIYFNGQILIGAEPE